MKIKALSTFRGDHGVIRRDAEVDVPDAYAKDLIKRGRAVAVDATAETEKPPVKPHVKPKGGKSPAEGE
jgi:hypothetical protein